MDKPDMDKSNMDELLEQMRETIQTSVNSGFYGSEETIESAVEIYSDEAEEEELRPHAEKMTAEAVAAHIELQKSWPNVTDCDRLDAAFRDLDAEGIVCRQNFSCCGNCGSSEIWEEMEGNVPPARGYAFYHAQDTDRAADGGGIYLNYGAVQEGEENAVSIGREVATMLAQYGLKVNWDGSFAKRIGVELDWKKRRSL